MTSPTTESEAASTEWHRLIVEGFVPSNISRRFAGDGPTTEVAEDGRLRLGDDLTLRFEDGSPYDPGTEVRVKLRRRNFYARSLDAEEAAERERERKQRRRKQRRVSRAERKRQEAAEFWDGYDIPIEWDTAIRPRRSGLLRGSAGTGHDAATVVHLHVKEAFRDGQLEREANTYLCEKGLTVDPNGREERRTADGEEYIPAVTCGGCLQRMSRWEADS